MSSVRSTALCLGVLVAWSAATPVFAQQVTEAQLGPAPRITDPRQLEPSRPEWVVVLPSIGVDPDDRDAVISLYRRS